MSLRATNNLTNDQIFTQSFDEAMASYLDLLSSQMYARTSCLIVWDFILKPIDNERSDSSTL